MHARSFGAFLLLSLVDQNSLWACCCCAFLSPAAPSLGSSNSRTRNKSTHLHVVLPTDYQDQGNELIYKAARLCGADDIEIEWKPGRIICTVSGDSVYLAAPLDENDLEQILLDEDEDVGDGEDELPSSLSKSSSGVDVTGLARAINAALDDDGGIGSRIAETHEIEVGTRGASDELLGDVMFQAYRGFDVIARHRDPKTQKIKTVEGRLVERDDLFTVINIKGRMKKLKNSNVISVKLPKAKKEKGAR